MTQTVARTRYRAATYSPMMGQTRRPLAGANLADENLADGNTVAGSTTPAKPTVLWALARIFRFEYLRATFPGLAMPFFLCARSPEDILHRAPIEGLLVIAFVIFSCLGINAIVDREIDEQHVTEKSLIARAVGTAGLARIWTIIAVMNVLAVILTVDLCLHFQSFVPAALVLTQAFFAYGYSLPPFKFKLRGVAAHAISLSLAVCFIPFLLAGYVFLGSLPATLVWFMLGFSVVQYGYEYANQALDYLEDSAAGLRTPAVRLGILRSMQASLVVPLIGMAILFAAFVAMYFERSAESDPARSAPEVLLASSVSMIILIIGIYLPISRTWQMLQLSRTMPPEACVPRFPDICHYPHWQASSVAGISAASAAFFVITNYVWQ